MRRFLLPAVAVIAILIGCAAALAWLSASRIDVARLARETPRTTALMQARAREAAAAGRAFRAEQHWVPYESISPLLRRAVLVAEDDAFFSHSGLDWNEIRASARKNLEKRSFVRGGSTITQQLAKNLWLSDRRTLTRKLEEAFLAVRLERALPKRRIFELYLNLIEWGDGVFGVEAAARHWFGVPASELDARQAVLLAAVIINPRRYSPLEPSRRTERRARMIATRMRRRGALDEEAYRFAIGERPRPAPVDTSGPWLAPRWIPPADTVRAAPADSIGSPAPGP